jgi:hypothetical protein
MESNWEVFKSAERAGPDFFKFVFSKNKLEKHFKNCKNAHKLYQICMKTETSDVITKAVLKCREKRQKMTILSEIHVQYFREMHNLKVM